MFLLILLCVASLTSIIGDPVLEKGLTYIPSDGNVRGSSGPRTTSSSSGNDQPDDIPPLRRPTSSIRGGVGTSGGGGASQSSRPSLTGGSSAGGGANSGGGGGGTGRPYSARESIAAGRDPSIVTRDPTAFISGIDDILGKFSCLMIIRFLII